jgi:hypothetical protein
MQPLRCMRASKDGGCWSFIRCGTHLGRRPSRLARKSALAPQGDGEIESHVG